MLLSVSMLRLAVVFIQLLLLASFLVLMNLALVCFKVVLLSIDGATSDFLLLSVHCVCCSGLYSSMVCSLFSHLLGYIPKFLYCLKNIIVKLFYSIIHIVVVDLNAVS